MENGTDRHSGNPITPQVQYETAARMEPECTHDHQGRSYRLTHRPNIGAQSDPRYPLPQPSLHHRGSPYRDR